MNKQLLLLSLIMLIFIGCRTNDLANYELEGKGIIYKDFVNAEARRIQIEEANVTNKEDKTVLGIIADIGSEIATYEDKTRLRNAVRTDELVGYVSSGLEEALVKYLNMETDNENPAFIAETTLEECKLIFSENSVSVMLKASSKLIDVPSGKLVWEDTEEQTIPISYSGTSKDDSKVLVRFVNALQLSSLSDAEINQVVGDAADDVGFKMGETLREDIIKARKKKK
jgi:hypothetical protein